MTATSPDWCATCLDATPVTHVALWPTSIVAPVCARCAPALEAAVKGERETFLTRVDIEVERMIWASDIPPAEHDAARAELTNGLAELDELPRPYRELLKTAAS